MTDSDPRWHQPPWLHFGTQHPGREPRGCSPRAWREETHSRPPGVRDTRRSPPPTHAASARSALGSAPPRLAGSGRDADAARGAGSPGATGWGDQAGWGRRAHLSFASRERGPRTLPRGQRERPAGGARARAATDRYREGLNGGGRSRGRSLGSRGAKRGGGQGEGKAAGRGAPRRSLRPPGPSCIWQDTAPGLPERPPLAGSAPPPR